MIKELKTSLFLTASSTTFILLYSIFQIQALTFRPWRQSLIKWRPRQTIEATTGRRFDASTKAHVLRLLRQLGDEVMPFFLPSPTFLLFFHNASSYSCHLSWPRLPSYVTCLGLIPRRRISSPVHRRWRKRCPTAPSLHLPWPMGKETVGLQRWINSIPGLFFFPFLFSSLPTSRQ